MRAGWSIYADWNPWHGCTKLSPGCKYCYVYRQDAMYGSEIGSDQARKTAAFDLPLKRRRDGSWKIPPGKVVFTCFTSDFLLKDADEWRPECWKMMKIRSDCRFYFFTKRIDRFMECVPQDWGDGYDNVMVGCTVENQAMANYRLPIFKSLPIKHKTIVVSPILGPVDVSRWLDGGDIEEVCTGGESGAEARPCDYGWILDLRRQCMEAGIAYRFHQTGARFIKDGRLYRIRRKDQIPQAQKAGIDHLIGEYFIPETVASAWPDSEPTLFSGSPEI